MALERVQSRQYYKAEELEKWQIFNDVFVTRRTLALLGIPWALILIRHEGEKGSFIIFFCESSKDFKSLLESGK
jgi:hypothetical protein